MDLMGLSICGDAWKHGMKRYKQMQSDSPWKKLDLPEPLAPTEEQQSQ